VDKWIESVWTEHLAPLSVRGQLRVLICGVGSGKTLPWILEQLACKDDDQVCGIDEWKNERKHARAAEQAARYLGRVFFRRADPVFAIDQGYENVPEQIDVAIVSGDYAKPSLDLFELLLRLWRKLRYGGILIVDNYRVAGDSGRMKSLHPFVDPFVDAARTEGQSVERVWHGPQAGFRKI